MPREAWSRDLPRSGERGGGAGASVEAMSSKRDGGSSITGGKFPQVFAGRPGAATVDTSPLWVAARTERLEALFFTPKPLGSRQNRKRRRRDADLESGAGRVNWRIPPVATWEGTRRVSAPECQRGAVRLTTVDTYTRLEDMGGRRDFPQAPPVNPTTRAHEKPAESQQKSTHPGPQAPP